MVILLTSACNYNDLKNPGSIQGKGGARNGQQTEGVVDFATVRAAVFEPACVKCHGPVISKKGLRLDQYASAFAKLDLIRSQVEDGEMPPPPPRGFVLTPEQRVMLFAWIDSGGPEKTVVTPQPPTPTEPTVPTEPVPPTMPPTEPVPPVPPVPPVVTPDFAAVSAAVFVPHCLKCHSNTVQKGKVNLEQYTNAARHATEIGEALDIDDMPRKAPALPPELKAIVYAWIDGGAPETVAPPAGP